MAAAIRLTMTAAGRAALRNPDGNGTRAVLVVTAGVTATAFVSGSPVPNEIKRVATIKGGATAADTIHVTISDTTADVYSVRGFGLYLDDGTLLASYGQQDVIVEKSAQAAMLIAADIQFADIDATTIIFGDTNFNNPAATTERVGVVELATPEEAATGTDAQRAVTPKALLAVLDLRFGAGAPSAFVKTLLNKLTVAAFVTALGIRSAAQYDTGAGNGLDADLLDGREGAFYLDWSNLTGRPSSFPPADHKHAASDITSGTFPIPRGGTGLASVPKGTFLVGNDTDPLSTLTPDQVRAAIGAAAKAHSHEMSDINGLGNALDGKADAGHKHAITDVTGLSSALDGKVAKGGDTMTGILTVAPPSTASNPNAGIILNRASGTNATAAFLQGAVNGKARWQLHLGDQSTEPGANNVGSDFQIGRYSDNGGFLGNAFGIARTDGRAYFTGPGIVQLFGVVGTGLYNGGTPLSFQANSGNADRLDIIVTRTVNGTNGWDTTSWLMRRQVDQTVMGGIEFGNPNTGDGVRLGIGDGSFARLGNGGSWRVSGTTWSAGGFQVGSSIKLKTRLRKLRYGLDAVRAIETRRGFYRKAYNRDGRERLFVLAEQLRDVVPQAVMNDGVEFLGEALPSVDYMQLVPVLIEAVKELASTVDSMKGKTK